MNHENENQFKLHLQDNKAKRRKMIFTIMVSCWGKSIFALHDYYVGK